MAAGKKETGGGSDKFKTILEQIQPEFIEDGARRIRSSDVAEVLDQAERVLAEFSKSDAFARFRKDGDLLVSALQDHSAGKYEDLPLWSVAVITFALQYVLKPVDIIPDSLPVIGRLDDAVVLSHCLLLVKADLRAYRVWRLAVEAGGS